MISTYPVQQTPDRFAISMFWQAAFQGWLHKIWAIITRRTSRLLELEDTLCCSALENSHYAGLKTVDINHIRGTQGKADAFDAEFNPIAETTRSRWVGIALQKLRGRELPPVELVKVGDIYYVRDGHHRISVAHSLGQQFIEAEVTVIRLRQRLM